MSWCHVFFWWTAWAYEVSAGAVPWADGRWYDVPADYDVPVTLCRTSTAGLRCPPSWSLWEGSCYLLIDRPSEYAQAAQRCLEHGGATVATIGSQEENEFVASLCGSRICWIGLLELAGTERWEWADGRPVIWNNWQLGEPNNFGGADESRAIMNFDRGLSLQVSANNSWAIGTWYDLPASFSRPKIICEAPVGEGGRCSSTWQSLDDMCYRMLDWHSDFRVAEQRCAELGAHLVTISSLREQEFVQSMCGLRMCWLGLKEEKHTEFWKWVDGSGMSYENWEIGEPNNAGGIDENRAVMNLNLQWVEEDEVPWMRADQVAKKMQSVVRKHSATLASLIGGSSLPSWADGTWYDAPKDFNLPITICKLFNFAVPASGGIDLSGWRTWEGNHYLVIDRFSDYPTAVARCEEHYGSSLVFITSSSENEFVRSLCGRNFCWLGLEEQAGSEDWFWSDGSPLQLASYPIYANWHAGEPNNYGGIDESVAIMNFNMRVAESDYASGGWASGFWFDVPGEFNQPKALCEKKPNPFTCAEGWSSGAGACYRLLDGHCTYSVAWQRCGALGGRLVSITSAKKQAVVANVCGENTCWLGLVQQDPSKDEHLLETWHWAGGVQLGYENWARGEPNNNGGHDENRAVMNLQIRSPAALQEAAALPEAVEPGWRRESRTSGGIRTDLLITAALVFGVAVGLGAVAYGLDECFPGMFEGAVEADEESTQELALNVRDVVFRHGVGPTNAEEDLEGLE